MRGWLEILCNFQASSLGITLIANCITKRCNHQHVLDYYSNRKFIYSLDPFVKQKLIQSLERILSTAEGQQAFGILDGTEGNSNEQEMNIICSLIQDNIVSIPDEVPLLGKVSLGGQINIQNASLALHNSSSFGLARFLAAYRHELAHLKWLRYGAGEDYTIKSPRVTNKNRHKCESRYLLDKATYWEFNIFKKPNIGSHLSESILLKIASGERLTQSELKSMYCKDFIEEDDDEDKGLYYKSIASKEVIFCQGRCVIYYQ